MSAANRSPNRSQASISDVRVDGGQPTRDRILEVATNLVLDQGYAGTPVSQIAKVVGVTTAAVYYHFRSKEELYYTLIDRWYCQFLADLLESVADDGPADELLRSFVRTYVYLQLRDGPQTNRHGYDQVAASLSDESRQKLAAVQRQYLDSLRDILEQGEREGSFSVPDVTVSAFAILSACEYVFIWFKRDGRLSAREVADIYADLALQLASAQPVERATRDAGVLSSWASEDSLGGHTRPTKSGRTAESNVADAPVAGSNGEFGVRPTERLRGGDYGVVASDQAVTSPIRESLSTAGRRRIRFRWAGSAPTKP